MPTPSHWDRLRRAFHAAADVDPAERPALLDEICADDSYLRAEVESLLGYDANGFSRRASGISIAEWFADGRVAVVQAALSEASTEEPAARQRLEPGSTVGPYVVGDLVGRGGMGEVYQARDTRLGRAVALKRLTNTT
jgi:serine/threonine protein kinase